MLTQANKIFDRFLALEGPRMLVAHGMCVQQACSVTGILASIDMQHIGGFSEEADRD